VPLDLSWGEPETLDADDARVARPGAEVHFHYREGRAMRRFCRPRRLPPEADTVARYEGAGVGVGHVSFFRSSCASPHEIIAVMIGASVRPVSVSAYSTRGGISGSRLAL